MNEINTKETLKSTLSKVYNLIPNDIRRAGSKHNLNMSFTRRNTNFSRPVKNLPRTIHSIIKILGRNHAVHSTLHPGDIQKEF